LRALFTEEAPVPVGLLDWVSRAYSVGDSDDLCSGPLSDLRLVDEGAPGHARVALFGRDVVALSNAVDVDVVGDVAVGLREDVLGLDRLDVAGVPRNLSVGVLRVDMGEAFVGFRDVAG